MTNEILDAAKKYCEQSFFVIPVGKNKVPHTIHGLKDATNDYNQFLKLYKPGDQIAILTGAINNLYVIDCDVEKDNNHRPVIKNGKTINTGEENFINKFINKNNAEKFKTKTIKTQSGGKQLYYKLRNNQVSLKTHIGILQKVDFKGDGGYVVSPPSEGQWGRYEVIVDAAIAFMPDELYNYLHELDMPDDSNEAIVPINFNDSTLSLLIKTIADIFKHPNGRGNELLMALAGAMALRGVSIEHTKEIVKESARINQWPDINYAVIDNSYNKVKNHEKVLGYTTFKKDVITNKDQYENFSEIIKNLESIFEFNNPVALINKAYDNNEIIAIEILKEWYKSLKNIDLKPSELDELIIKFKKIVYVSLASLLHATRLKHKGPDNTDIIDDQIYIKLGKMYRADSSNSYIRGILNSIFNNNISSRAKLEIIAQISDLASIVDYEDATSIIKFQNDYIYNLKTKEITPFTDDTFVIKQFGFNYDPNATCQEWLNFINTSVDNKDIPVLQEFLGYIFYKGLPAQNFLVLKGPTRAGKGTVLGIIEDMLGESNVSSVPASALFSKEDTHMDLWQLEGKLANLDGEVEPYDLMHIANLKKLTGMDSIVSNQKYKNQHSFINVAKLLFALNSLPKIKLNDAEVDSFLSRIIIVNFIHSHADDADPTLKDRLETEISGIFNWMLEGLKRLKNNNFLFSNTHSITEKARIYALTSDPLKVFCDNLIVPGDDEFEPKNLYSIFLKFCSYNNVDPSMNVKSLLSFQRQLSNILKARDDLNFLSKPAGHKNQVHYFGFSIKDPKNINNDSNPENLDPPKYLPDNKGHDNFDLNSLPEGSIKQSLKEEQELKDFKEQKLEEKQEAHQQIEPVKEKTIVIPKSMKTHYYQALKNFNKYDASFFIGSDILFDSSRIIPKKESTETAYVLLKLIIPVPLNKTPKEWNSFLSDSKEISETDFNILSRGDSQ